MAKVERIRISCKAFVVLYNTRFEGGKIINVVGGRAKVQRTKKGDKVSDLWQGEHMSTPRVSMSVSKMFIADANRFRPFMVMFSRNQGLSSMMSWERWGKWWDRGRDRDSLGHRWRIGKRGNVREGKR